MSYSRFRKRLKPLFPNANLRRKVFGPSLPRERHKKRLTLGMPATYRICVQGFLEKRWADRLGDMHITTRNQENQAPVSILIGRMRDQAELMGVVSSLYELQLPLLSVELLTCE